MYELSNLTDEIERSIEELDLENVRALSPDLVTEMVIAGWGEIEGDCADRFICTAHALVRDRVRKRINRYKIIELEPDDQQIMEGFERIQKRYNIEESGQRVAIRVQDMSSEQRLYKAAELRTMGMGCLQHAEELERYDQDVASASA